MSDIILDSSAILAVINQERGADRVLAVADGAMVSALIVAEVVSWMAVRKAPADNIHETIENFKLTVQPFDHSRAIAAGLLVIRTARRGLSLADRACLALAIEFGLPVLTGDRAWKALDLGIDIQLIR
jgi:PIN domain nuclease of toxin-antitoxin system